MNFGVMVPHDEPIQDQPIHEVKEEDDACCTQEDFHCIPLRCFYRKRGGQRETEQTEPKRNAPIKRLSLFLIRLRWHGCLHVFGIAAKHQTRIDQPQLVTLLHLRAARFYEAQHEWREAITHALTVPDHAYAASLMEQAAWPFWLRGEARTIHTWVFSLPDAILRAFTWLWMPLFASSIR